MPPSRLPVRVQVQLRTKSNGVTVPAYMPMGIVAKLPVAISRPRKLSVTKPAGNINPAAPSGMPEATMENTIAAP